MKKKLLGIAIVAIVTIGAAWNVNANKNKVTISNLVLANVEALAQGESGGRCTGPKTNGDCESRNTNPCSDTSGCNS